MPSNPIMRGGRRASAIAGVSSALTTLVAVSAFAQSDSERRWDVRTALAAERTGFDAVRVYRTGAAVSLQRGVLPPNLRFFAAHRSVIESMLRHSPTFRRQCLRIANAPSLTILVQRPQTRQHERIRARTKVSTGPGGQTFAVVEISALDDQVELIAHELEHIIEQLDGVDLAYGASLPATGVRLTENGAFETLRAVRVGVAVSREVRRAGG